MAGRHHNFDPGHRERRYARHAQGLWLRLVKTALQILVTVTALALCTAAHASQKKHIRFERISTEQGLSQFSIQCMAQDHKGFMWFGTQDGLNKYDGYVFTVYKNSLGDRNSISANDVMAIFEDSQKVLWIGTEGGGLNRFEAQTESFSHFKHDDQDPSSLSGNDVFAIFEDSTGTLWVGTKGGGLNRFDDQTNTFTRFRHDEDDPSSLSDDHVNVIFEDSAGTLWIGTGAGGLNRFDPDTGRFSHFTHDDQNPSSLSHNHLFTIIEDSSGMLWIGAENGVNRFDPRTTSFTRFMHDDRDPSSISVGEVLAIQEDARGALWFGTLKGGLNRLDRNSTSFIHFTHDAQDPTSLSQNEIFSICEDFSGTLWFGTMKGGLNRFNPQTEAFGHLKHDNGNPASLSHNHAFAIHEDSKGVIWVGTNGGGLNRLDPNTGDFSHYRHDKNDPSSLGHDIVQVIYEDSRGVLWVGTAGGGLDRFEPQTETFIHLRHDEQDPTSLGDDYIEAICEDSFGDLWIGTWGGGLNRFDPFTGEMSRFSHTEQDPTSLAHDVVMALHEDSHGALWVGTWGGGLSRFDRRSNSFIHFTHDDQDPSSLSSDRVSCLTGVEDGTLWVGTSGGGFNRMIVDNEQVRFERITTQDGLAADAIGGILEDDSGRLWLSTTQGISRFNPKTETIKNYGSMDGVQGSGYWIGAYLKDGSGTMYFGGTQGITVFDPDDVEENTVPPRIVLTEFLLFNQEVHPWDAESPLSSQIDDTRAIVLNHRQYLFSIDFAALHYAQPEENSYAYKMEGIDEEWVLTDAENRRATYTTLPSGHYTFRVKASNKDGYWNEDGRSLKVRILPPFWKTWWAYCLYGISALALTAGIVIVRERSLKNQARELERTVHERTEEIRQNLQELQTLDRIVENINRMVGLKQVMEACLEQGLELLPQAFGGVFVGREHSSEGFQVVAVSGWEPDLALGIAFGAEETLKRYRADSVADGVYIVHDPQIRPGADKVIHIRGASTLVSIELVVDDEILGFLVFDLTEKEDSLSRNDIQRLRRYRQHAINALAKAGLVNDLERANQAKNAFLATMSHELRTPLNSIIGFSDLTIQKIGDDLPDPFGKFLTNIRSSARHLLSLINDILDLSKVEAGRMELEMEQISISNTVESVCRVMEGMLSERNIQLIQEIPSDLPPAVLDGGKLKQILFNLISNAVKFSPENATVTVSVRLAGAQPNPADNGFLEIAIRDQGVGIKAEDQVRVFDAFTQLDDELSRSSQGTGLGLALVKRFVEMQGGSISVESEPGQGSTFTILLPRDASHLADPT